MVILAFYIGRGDMRDQAIRVAQSAKARRWQQASHVEALAVPVVREANTCISASKRDRNKVRRKVIRWKPGNWTFVCCPNVSGRDFLRRVEPHVGKPYDTWGAVASVLPLERTGGHGRWFCSELMAHGLGLPDPHRWTPGALHEAVLGIE